MGHYFETINSNGLVVSTLGMSISNPNTKFIFQIFDLKDEAIGWSGDKRIRKITLNELANARNNLNQIEVEDDLTDLPTINELFNFIRSNKFSDRDEKDRVVRFIDSCIKESTESGDISIYFG